MGRIAVWKSSVARLHSFMETIVQGHEHQPPGMQKAQIVAARVGKEDFVVGGWVNVSILYGDISAGAGQYMDFTSEAGSHGRGATTHLREAILKTLQMGDASIFLEWLTYQNRTGTLTLDQGAGCLFRTFSIGHTRMFWQNLGAAKAKSLSRDLIQLDLTDEHQSRHDLKLPQREP